MCLWSLQLHLLRQEKKILEQYRRCHILLVTTINVDPPFSFFSISWIFLCHFSHMRCHIIKKWKLLLIFYSAHKVSSPVIRRGKSRLSKASEKGSIVFLNEISLEKGLLCERMYPQKAMIRKFLGLKVICALTNWIATTMLMDFLLRIISSDMSLLKEVVRITITFNSHCPRAAFEKLRQRVDLKIFHRYISWHIFLNMWLLLKKVKSLQPEERMILRNSISCYCLR